jgi:hypothetical protein
MKYLPAPLTPFVASLLCIRRRTHILIEHREPKYLNQLSANTTAACGLFALSLQRFRPLACLFSTACSLFCKNTRGGGIPDGSAGRPEWGTALQFGSPQRAKSFASYHIPATLAFSGAYALFRATAARQTLSPQSLTHSFYHNRGGTPRAAQNSASRFVPVANDAIFNDHPMSSHCYTAHVSLNWTQ